MNVVDLARRLATGVRAKALTVPLGLGPLRDAVRHRFALQFGALPPLP